MFNRQIQELPGLHQQRKLLLCQLLLPTATTLQQRNSPAMLMGGVIAIQALAARIIHTNIVWDGKMIILIILVLTKLLCIFINIPHFSTIFNVHVCIIS